MTLLLAAVSLGVAWGNSKGREWSWVGALLLQGFGILFTIGGILNQSREPTSGIGILIGLAIVYYFTRPRVQAYFGRGLAPQELGQSTSNGEPGQVELLIAGKRGLALNE